jgi:predicted RNA-binding Zn ribbon-like protein
MATLFAPPPTAIPVNWADHACLDLVNSTWLDHLGASRRFDRLPLPEFQSWFLARWKLGLDRPLGRLDVAELGELRSLLRRLLEEWSAGRHPAVAEIVRLNGYLAAAPLLRRLDSDALRLALKPARRDRRWLAAELVTSAVELMATGEPGRLKVCQNDACSWMFYDASANRSRRWCDGNACGNLLKVRRFRSRPKKPAG